MSDALLTSCLFNSKETRVRTCVQMFIKNVLGRVFRKAGTLDRLRVSCEGEQLRKLICLIWFWSLHCFFFFFFFTYPTFCVIYVIHTRFRKTRNEKNTIVYIYQINCTQYNVYYTSIARDRQWSNYHRTRIASKMNCSFKFCSNSWNRKSLGPSYV